MADPYAELRRHAGGNHPQKAKLNVVLSAITDVIFEQRGKGAGANARDTRAITPTEYFAALMTALESASGSHQQELTTLLSMVLPSVPPAVLRSKFSNIASLLMNVIQEAEGDNALLRSASSCLGQTLMALEPSNDVWSRPEVLRAFTLLLSLATDSRPKVRKVGQKWTTDILSEHVTETANRPDALSKHIASFASSVLDSATGKDESRLVLFIAFLKSALPLLHAKVIGSLVDKLLKYLDASAPTLRVVTYDALQAVTTSEHADFPLKTSMAILNGVLNADKPTVHDAPVAISVVRILSSCLTRVHLSDASTSRSLLPRVVGSICAHLENEQKRVHKQACASLLSLLSECLPPDMLQSQHATTDINRVLTSLQSLMSLRFQGAWNQVFSMLADLFSVYQEASHPALDNIIVTACELHETSEQMPQTGNSSASDWEKLFEQVVSSAVVAIGPETFLSLISLSHPQDVVSEKKRWLLPVLRDALKDAPSTRLSFFIKHVLPLAKDCESKSRHESTSPLEAKRLQALSMQLWALFPSVCMHAEDIDESFKSIAKLLANAMADQRYPELRLIVCRGLQALVKRTKSVSRGHEDEDEDDDTTDNAIEDEAKLQRDRAALSKYASRYLPLLTSYVEEIDPEKQADSAKVLLDTIEGFASLAESAFVSSMFKKIVQKLLQDATEAEKDASHLRSAHTQLNLAVALLEHMDEASVSLLYRVIKPYLVDDRDAGMQKRSYAALVAICDTHPSFLGQQENLTDMTEAVCASLLTCSVPAKKMRLRCLVHLITALQSVNDVNIDELVPNLVGEVMLCTKEANGKAREAAFGLLLAMAELMRIQKPESGLSEYMQMVLGGLAARTPHMRSASVICLSRLVFEYGRSESELDAQVIRNMMPQLLKTVLMLLHEKAREVIKSVIGFMKLGIALLPVKELRAFLPDMVNGLLVWVGESKNRFRAKTRVILSKLCRKFSYEEVAELVPADDRALIKHIKKTKEREAKKKAEAREQHKKGDSFEDFMADSDDEGDEEDVKQALKRQKERLHSKGKVIQENDDDIVDFLDTNAAVRNIHTAGDHDDSSDDDMGELQTAKDGRMIIPGDDQEMEDEEDEEDDAKVKGDVAAQLEKMGLGQNGNNKRKRGKDDQSELGKEFRSKKASGDMKKKGKLEPYAYIPLDPKLMAKRNKRSAVAHYSNSVGKRRKNRK